MSENDRQSSEHLIDEYKELNNNMRYYGNSRFVHLTLFVALTGVLLNTIFTNNALEPILLGVPVLGIFSITVKTSLSIVGLVVTLVFFIFEKRAVDYWAHFRCRAKQLDNILGFEQYSTRPEPRLILGKKVNATNAAKALYFFFAVGWAWMLIITPLTLFLESFV